MGDITSIMQKAKENTVIISMFWDDAFAGDLVTRRCKLVFLYLSMVHQ